MRHNTKKVFTTLTALTLTALTLTACQEYRSYTGPTIEHCVYGTSEQCVEAESVVTITFPRWGGE